MQGPFFSGALILGTQKFKFHFLFLNFENALRPVENQGDDATENDNFPEEKQRLQGRKNLNFIFV